jgi:hypothetical protein
MNHKELSLPCACLLCRVAQQKACDDVQYRIKILQGRIDGLLNDERRREREREKLLLDASLASKDLGVVLDRQVVASVDYFARAWP